MKKARINDLFAKGGYIRADGVMIHDMYVMQVKTPQESKYPWDYYKLVKVMPGEEAFGPITGLCPLRAEAAGGSRRRAARTHDRRSSASRVAVILGQLMLGPGQRLVLRHAEPRAGGDLRADGRRQLRARRVLHARRVRGLLGLQ